MLEPMPAMSFPFYYLPGAFRAYVSPKQADDFLNYLIPPLDKKLSFTLDSVPYTISPIILVYFMAYLARRPNTWHLRLALAPFALIASLRIAYAYECKDPSYGPYNFGIGKSAVMKYITHYAYQMTDS